MTRRKYTMFLPGGEDDEIIAESITLERALVIAVEHGSTGKAAVRHREWGDFRVFEIGRLLPDTATFERILEAVVRRTGDSMADADDAMAWFGEVLLNDTRVFWSGGIESDEDYARRLVDGESTRPMPSLDSLIFD